jgi:serine/threonine-protein kinase
LATAISTAEEPFAPALVTDPELRIGHVLFIDVVGYSRLLINEQHECLHTLNRVVRQTDAFRTAEASGTLTRMPTGDGMVLVFTSNPDAPVRCALQVSEALRCSPEFSVRMGIHSGPVSGITDVNDGANFAGAGINLAQRVMDCGDAGHILLSQRVAEDLAHYREWNPHLHAIGEVKVKHGVTISLFNFYSANVGNPQLPAKLKARAVRSPAATTTSRSRLAWIVLGTIGVAVVAAFGLWSKGPTPASTPRADAPFAAVPAKSIAVLPFENLSANQETAYFTDGVHDEILSNLAKVADLKVISRTSVMQYRTAPARNLREIAQQLGVAHVLEGSVQRIENRVRINAQLIDARTDAHLWAQTYDRDLADVFAIQSEISKTIADQLQARLSPQERLAIAQPATIDPIAERLYVEGWQHVERASNPDGKAALLEAIPLLEEAIARDPKFIRAYGLLFTAHIDLYWQGFDHTPARLELARQTIERGAEVNPDAGEIHMARADYVYKASRDYDAARAELDLARRSMPNNPLIYIYNAAMDRRQGRWEESIRHWERGVEIDPRNYRYLMETAFTYQVLRRFPESARTYRRALSVRPDDQFARAQLAQLPFFERANLETWETELAAVASTTPAAESEIANGLFFCGLAKRDAALTSRALRAIAPEGLRDTFNNSLWARDWFVGLAARTFGDHDAARTAFSSAREVEAKIVAEQPEYAPAWSRLGLIDAALGRKAEAIAEGLRACELLPVSKDTLDGPSYVTNLAMIYAWVGEKDLACEQLAASAKMPVGVTYGELKLSPQWDALRGYPRFEKIVASLAPKA